MRSRSRNGLGSGDEQPEDPAALRVVADGLDHGLARADGDELHERVVVADDTEGAVARTDELAGGLDHLVQHDRQAEAGGDAQHRVEQAVQLVVGGDGPGDARLFVDHGAYVRGDGVARRPAAYTAACVRRSMPSFVSRFET